MKRPVWLLAAVLLAGCSTSIPGAAAPADGAAASIGWSVRTALTGLPSAAVAEPGAVVVVADLDAATELAGASRPTDVSDADGLAQWSLAIANDAGPSGEQARVCTPLPDAANPDFLLRVGEFDAELGWSLLDVASFAEVQAPPHPFSVLTGDFSQADLDAAMGPAVDGVWRVGPDTDGDVELSGRSAARPLGESLRLGLRADDLAVARYTAPVQDWLAGAPDLAADAPYADLARALDAQGVYAAMIVQPVKDDQAPMGRLVLAGVGMTGSGDEARMVVTFVFAGAGDAGGSETALQDYFTTAKTQSGQRWSDVVTVEKTSLDGLVLTGVLRLEPDRTACTAWASLYLGELVYATSK
jgi:hypothetical protein